MKIKKIKYYTALLFMALNISLTGCQGKLSKESSKTSDIEIKKTEDIEKEMDAKVLRSHINMTINQAVTTALLTLERIEGIKEGLGELVDLESIHIYQNKNKEKYQLDLRTKNQTSYNSIIENSLESLTSYMKYMAYTSCNTIELSSCDNISILDTIANKEKITTIVIDNSPDEDLNILATFPNLEKLVIENCPNIENIDALSALKNLKSLSLIGTKVTDMKSISELTEVSALDLRCNELTEEGIESLSGLPNLKKVDLYYNRIYDPDALNDLEEKGLESDGTKHLVVATSTSNLLITTEENHKKTKFSRLVISKIKAKDKYFVSLEDENGIVEKYGLLDNIEIAKLWNHQYDEITLHYCENCDMLKNVEQPDKVKKVSIWHCDFEQLEYLERFENAEELVIWGNPSLSDIGNVSEMKGIKGIYIENTNISDITPLSHLQMLETVHLPMNSVEDISVLENLPNLKTVDVRFNSINDENQIEQLKEVIFDMKTTLDSQTTKKEEQKTLGTMQY